MDDKNKGHRDPESSPIKNYRPITCLPIMGENINSRVEIYYMLINHRSLPEKQK